MEREEEEEAVRGVEHHLDARSEQRRRQAFHLSHLAPPRAFPPEVGRALPATPSPSGGTNIRNQRALTPSPRIPQGHINLNISAPENTYLTRSRWEFMAFPGTNISTPEPHSVDKPFLGVKSIIKVPNTSSTKTI